jgi:hypothetical protein
MWNESIISQTSVGLRATIFRKWVNFWIWNHLELVDFEGTLTVLIDFCFIFIIKDLGDPVVRALRRAIAEVKQRWLVIGWVTKNV